MNKFHNKKDEQDLTNVVEESKEVEKMSFWERNKGRIFIGAITALAGIAGVVTVCLFNGNDESEESFDEIESFDQEDVDQK